MSRFILIDPCLKDEGTHPYQYCLDVLDAADRAGFTCEAVVPSDSAVGSGQWPERFGLNRVLDVPGYSKYDSSGEYDTLRVDGTPRWRFLPPWAARHAESRREEHIALFAEALAGVVGRASAGDVVLLATASDLSVAGLARAIRGAGSRSGVGWHALFHYPIYRGLGPEFARQERRIDRLRRLLAEALAVAAPARLHIHVTTAELAAQYARLGVATVGVLPYPVRAISRATRAVHGRPLRVATLGDARPEKGSHRLADVVERAIADPGLAGKLHFVIQANAGFAPLSRNEDDRAVVESLRRLAELARDHGRPGEAAPRIELIHGPLESTTYRAQLMAADATILAYDQDRYRTRCSGVLLESLASGVVPIVTGGGSMGRLLAEPTWQHVESLLARSRRLASERYGPLRTSRARPWRVAIELPSDATAVVVAARWVATGPEALLAVPAAIEVEQDGRWRSVALLAADPGGLATAAVLPLTRAPSRPRRWGLRVTPADHASALDLATVKVSVIDSGDRPAVSAAGIVVPPCEDVAGAVVEALREFVIHAEHYVVTARAHAAGMADRCRGDRVVEALVAASRQPPVEPVDEAI